MKTVLASDKSCSLKGVQKVFYFTTGQVASCCQEYPKKLSNYHSFDQLLQGWQQENNQMAQGHEVPSCKPCWVLEHQNLQSLRQQPAITPESIEISASNLCNQMCSYCSPRYSSEWQQSIQQHGVFLNVSKSTQLNQTPALIEKNTDIWIEQIAKYISQKEDESVVIKLLGGEPLMQQRNLEQLLVLNNNKIKKIRVHTNLNPPTNKFLKWLLDTCPSEKLHLDVSLDATPLYNHVPRSGFDCNKFLDNLNTVRKHSITVNLFSVISVLSIFDYENFSIWREQQGLETEFVRLNNPDCLDPKYIPTEFLQQALSNTKLKLDNYTQELLDCPQPMVDLKLFEQYNYLKQYFVRTGTQVNNTVFEPYWNWLKERYENSIGI